MTTEKLEEIAGNSADMLKQLICGSSDAIREAMVHVLEEAQIKSQETDTEPKAKLNLIHRLEIDLTKMTQKDSLAWSVSHKVEATQLLPDEKTAEEREEKNAISTLNPLQPEDDDTE